MKTLEQIKESKFQDDDFDLSWLTTFIPESDLKDFGISLEDKYVGKHIPIAFTRENILDRLEQAVESGFEAALKKNALSAALNIDLIQILTWVLDEGFENIYQDFSKYGLPILKATAIKYGFNNPIGEDSGSEEKYGYDE